MSQALPKDEKRIKLSQVQSHWGVSRSTVNTWIERGLEYEQAGPGTAIFTSYEAVIRFFGRAKKNAPAPPRSDLDDTIEELNRALG